MDKELEYIKKHYGENFAKLCRKLFPTMLECPGELTRVLEENFAQSRFLYEDMLEVEDDFRQFILSKSRQEVRYLKTGKSPFQLMEEAGYNLYYCENYGQALKFKKYYTEDESICTFYDEHREKNNYVFFAVRKNVSEIKREMFSNPKREDEYSTSVLSIQFSKGIYNYVKIISRYNHTVQNPDATFGNDLEQIIPGLTQAFIDEYGLDIVIDDVDFSHRSYCMDESGIFHKFNIFDENEIYYGPDNFCMDGDGRVAFYDKSCYEIIDNFILDLKNKQIISLIPKYRSFADMMPNIKKIEKIMDKQAKQHTYVISYSPENNQNLLTAKIIVNEKSEIVGYENKNANILPDYFMARNLRLKKLDVPNVKVIGNFVLMDNLNLKSLNLDNVEYVGDEFLWNNANLDEISMKNVVTIGYGFLTSNEKLRTLSLPKVQEIGHKFICINEELYNFEAPKLKIVGNDFLSSDCYLASINYPELKQVGRSFLKNNVRFVDINLPNLVRCGDMFLEHCNSDEVYLPKLEETGEGFLRCAKVENVKLNMVEIAGARFMSRAQVSYLFMPSLEIANRSFCEYVSPIIDVDFPNLRYVDDYFMINAITVKRFSAPKLEIAGNEFMSYVPLDEIYLPSLRQVGTYAFSHNTYAKFVKLPLLENVDPTFLLENRIAEYIYLPNLKTVPSYFLSENMFAREVDFSGAEQIGESVLNDNTDLEYINIQNATDIPCGFLSSCKNIEKICTKRLKYFPKGFIANAKNYVKLKVRREIRKNNEKS